MLLEADLWQAERNRDLAFLAGWSSEWCARQGTLRSPQELLGELFAPPAATKQDATVELAPEQVVRLFREMTEALGGEVRR